MELIKKVLSDEKMPESQARAFQVKVGRTAKAIDAGKTIEEIAEILHADKDTAEAYVELVNKARRRKKIE